MTTAEPLGNRVDRLIRNRALTAWTHMIVGIAGGGVLAFAMIYSGHIRVHLTWAQSRGFGTSAAIFFVFGFLPLLGSYRINIDRIDEDLMRTMRFLFSVVVAGLVVDGAVMYIIQAGGGFWDIAFFYLAQFSLYLWVGGYLMPTDR